MLNDSSTKGVRIRKQQPLPGRIFAGVSVVFLRSILLHEGEFLTAGRTLKKNVGAASSRLLVKVLVFYGSFWHIFQLEFLIVS